MITQIFNSFCGILDVFGATVYQMQKSEDFSNLSKQTTNKDMCGYQLVSREIQSHTRHLHNTQKHKSATTVYISSGVQGGTYIPCTTWKKYYPCNF
jgi:hypothetical protein